MREVKVAVVGPLTGPRAAYGELIEATVAAFRCPDGMHLQLFDDQAVPEKAVKTACDIRDAAFDVVVGHFNSDCARAVRPVYAAAGMPLLLPASTGVGLPDGRHVFRLCPNDLQQTEAMLAFVRERFADARLHCWSDGSPYAKRLRALLEQALGHALPPGTGSVTVYLGSHVAIMRQIASEGEDRQGRVSLCCDDCWIDEFRAAAPERTYVCAPHASYGDLLEKALSIVQCVYLEERAAMAQFFDESGEGHDSRFRMIELQDRRTRYASSMAFSTI